MAQATWSSIRDKRRRSAGLTEADEKLRVIHSQVGDATDSNGWCFVYDYSQGHYRYVHWLDAVDLLRQHRASLADRPTAGGTEILR